MAKLICFIFILFSILIAINVKSYGKKEENLPSKIDYKGSEMLLIPAGIFWMGSQISEGELDEHPQHKVYLDNYYIDKYEVTNKQFCEFLNEKGSHRGGNIWWIVIEDKYCLIEKKNGTYYSKADCDNYPVVCVTWEGANAYADWKGTKLPTEAQWEKAAKGDWGYLYPWGMDWDKNKCNNKSMDKPELLSVMMNFYNGRGVILAGMMTEDASLYGVMNMAGNVREWCSDWYDEKYYASSPYKNPQGPKIGKYKVIRGGSWESDNSNEFRCSDRFTTDYDRGFGIGFRCVFIVEER